jgi:uncharacterized protein (DUF2141 family)
MSIVHFAVIVAAVLVLTGALAITIAEYRNKTGSIGDIFFTSVTGFLLIVAILLVK